MYVSAHGCVANTVLEVLCFYKPGFAFIFQGNLWQEKKVLNFLSNFHSGWLGKGTLLHI